jgi:hypothetical protein
MGLLSNHFIPMKEMPEAVAYEAEWTPRPGWTRREKFMCPCLEYNPIRQTVA